ncbi:MAG: helix-turn-helix domain-containing protein [Isosphaeraceae bacterium]
MTSKAASPGVLAVMSLPEKPALEAIGLQSPPRPLPFDIVDTPDPRILAFEREIVGLSEYWQRLTFGVRCVLRALEVTSLQRRVPQELQPIRDQILGAGHRAVQKALCFLHAPPAVRRGLASLLNVPELLYQLGDCWQELERYQGSRLPAIEAIEDELRSLAERQADYREWMQRLEGEKNPDPLKIAERQSVAKDLASVNAEIAAMESKKEDHQAYIRQFASLKHAASAVCRLLSFVSPFEPVWYEQLSTIAYTCDRSSKAIRDARGEESEQAFLRVMRAEVDQLARMAWQTGLDPARVPNEFWIKTPEWYKSYLSNVIDIFSLLGMGVHPSQEQANQQVDLTGGKIFAPAGPPLPRIVRRAFQTFAGISLRVARRRPALVPGLIRGIDRLRSMLVPLSPVPIREQPPAPVAAGAGESPTSSPVPIVPAAPTADFTAGGAESPTPGNAHHPALSEEEMLRAIKEKSITVEEAAQRAGVSARMVREHCKNKVIKGTLIGREWFIDPESLQEYIDNPPKRGRKPKPAKGNRKYAGRE